MEKSKKSYGDLLKQLQTEQNILFENCSFDSIYLNVNQRIRVKSVLTFKNCDFSDFQIINHDFEQQMHFHQCTFPKDLVITNCNFYSRFIAGGIVAKNIRIWNNNFLNSFNLYRYEANEEVILQFAKTVGSVHIEQEFSKLIRLKKTHIQFEDLSDCSAHIERLNSDYVEIDFPNNQLLENNISIADIEANDCRILFLKNGSANKIRIARVKVNTLTFVELHNDGLLSIKNISGDRTANESYFRMQDSYLGKCELYHINLQDFKKLQIYNCHLQDIIPVNVKWNFDFNAYKDIKADYLKELFRQFKTICSKNMDKVGQLRFEQMEMHFYNSQLNWQKDFIDWFILKTNRWSNNHGQNWFLPVAWLFSFSYIFYTLVNYCSGSFSCYHIGNYLNFVVPLHSIKSITCNQDVQNNWISFWDVLQKLFSSYFIFQFLRAFRKYVN